MVDYRKKPSSERKYAMNVELVNVETRDGVRLDGILRVPSGSGSSRIGADLVILHHGVTGNFYHPGMFDQYGDALLDRGSAVLRVNNRGHDPISRAVVGTEARQIGSAYEDMDECIYDWEAWVDFAQAQGYRNICLWGHSLGATKTILYMAKKHDPRVKCVVAGSPPRCSYSAYISTEEGPEFERIISQAKNHIDEGHPEALLDVDIPFPLLLTAEIFLQKYGPEEKYDIVKHIPNVRVPMLIMIGTEEAQTITGFKGLPAKVDTLAQELETLTFASIPGADHSYTHQRDYVWGVVSDWLENV